MEFYLVVLGVYGLGECSVGCVELEFVGFGDVWVEYGVCFLFLEKFLVFFLRGYLLLLWSLERVVEKCLFNGIYFIFGEKFIRKVFCFM